VSSDGETFCTRERTTDERHSARGVVRWFMYSFHTYTRTHYVASCCRCCAPPHPGESFRFARSARTKTIRTYSTSSSLPSEMSHETPRTTQEDSDIVARVPNDSFVGSTSPKDREVSPRLLGDMAGALVVGHLSERLRRTTTRYASLSLSLSLARTHSHAFPRLPQ